MGTLFGTQVDASRICFGNEIVIYELNRLNQSKPVAVQLLDENHCLMIFTSDPVESS